MSASDAELRRRSRARGRRGGASATGAPVLRDEAAFLALQRKLFANG